MTPLDRWRATPIPAAPPADALGYPHEPFEPDARSDEPLVDLGAAGVATDPWYARTDGTNAPYGRPLPGADPVVRVRASVADRLVAAEALLRPHGLGLLVWDGWRSIACQRGIWEHFLALARALHPDATPAEHRAFAGRYASDPSRFDPTDPSTWPTHNTGGAVDLTLRRLAGDVLPMGTAFDEASPLTPAAAAEAPGADPAWRENRRVLHGVLRDVGFVSYPEEWWHFDFGTQMARHFARAEKPGAVYGPVLDDGTPVRVR